MWLRGLQLLGWDIGLPLPRTCNPFMEMVGQTPATAYGNGRRDTSYHLWKWLNRQQLPFMEMVDETPAIVYGNGVRDISYRLWKW
jgi:hypothetical protein